MPVESGRDRRKCRRVYLGSGRRIEWRTCGSKAPGRKGWLKDTSLTGVAFLVEANRRPRVGEQLEMGPRAHGKRPLLYKVVRVWRFEGQIALVACTALSSGAQTHAAESRAA